MTAESNHSASRDQRVNQIIATYLEAQRAGQAPSPEQLLTQHPDLAAELASFFAGKDQFERLVKPLAPASLAAAPTIAPAAPAGPLPGNTVRYFGDYELLEEIARGGMGVVFKARQVSFNRIVALKMVRDQHLASADDVRRFRTEAEAEANHDHPNIVPIYEVGEHQGQHYFSMKLVECAGASLVGGEAGGRRLSTHPRPRPLSRASGTCRHSTCCCCSGSLSVGRTRKRKRQRRFSLTSKLGGGQMIRSVVEE